MASNFFTTTKKGKGLKVSFFTGELYELKADLNSEYRDKRKDAVKRVIAAMTVGKDVSPLFADVVKNMQTEDLELKKLVYLYLMNYAKTQPELVILAVNTFVKDSDDPNALIRALALRTMGCLRVDKIIDYLMEPLKKGLRDSDPYVRKTAAICVAKVFDLNPSLAVENGLVTILQEMLTDKNPMVIANVVAALAEISESPEIKDVFIMNTAVLTKLLAALNECTEWGQICILNSLANYHTKEQQEITDVIERVIPRLQHANSSVVLSAVRVLMVFYDMTQSDELKANIVKKLSPPLVTLLSSQAEIQYVALKNINLILQKEPAVLSQEIRVFFTKYNDPPYVKLQKLEVLLKLCSEKNIDQLLSELKEYAQEVDVEFVRKAVRTIGLCAIKIESAAEKCVNVLLELIKSRVDYIVQEATSVIKDIFRKFPNKYEGIIPALCENLDVLEEPEAKAALIWIIGEYAERISNAEELLAYFADNFKDDHVDVQLQLLTACVKLFLKRGGAGQAMVQNLLQQATQKNDNPDIRDRAFIYWRLLSNNPQLAKTVVLAGKEPIQIDISSVSEALLEELIHVIGSLSSVYHKSPALLGHVNLLIRKDENVEEEQLIGEAVGEASAQKVENLLDLEFDGETAQTSPAKSAIQNVDDLLGGLDISTGLSPPRAQAPIVSTTLPINNDPYAAFGSLGLSATPDTAGNGASIDILGLNSEKNSPSKNTQPMDAFSALRDLGGVPASNTSGLDLFAGIQASAVPKIAYKPFVDVKKTLLNTPNGLEIKGTFSKQNGAPSLDLTFINHSNGPLTDFAIQFNANSYSLAPAAPLSINTPLLPNSTVDIRLPMCFQGKLKPMNPTNLLQVAVKTNLGVVYFETLIPAHILFSQNVTSASLGVSWLDPRLITNQFSVSGVLSGGNVAEKLKANYFVLLNQQGTTTQVGAKLETGHVVLVECQQNSDLVQVTAKSTYSELLSSVQLSLEGILRN